MVQSNSTKRYIRFPKDPVWEIAGGYDTVKCFDALELLLRNYNLHILINVSNSENLLNDDLFAEEDNDIRVPDEFVASLVPGKIFTIKLTKNLLGKLKGFANKFPESEYCEDMLIYDADGSVLIDATGFGHEDMHISSVINEATIKELTELIGSSYSIQTMVYGK